MWRSSHVSRRAARTACASSSTPPTVRFLLEVTIIGELLDIVDVDPGFDLDEPPGNGAGTTD